MEGSDESDALAVRIKQLDTLLQQKEDDLHLAAEIGKQLLKNNSQLTAQIDEANASATSKVEELEQEKFSLSRKLDAKEHMERTYLDEIEMLKSTLSKQSESMRLKIEMQHDTEVQPLKSRIATLQSELDQSHLVQSQLRETVRQAETMLSDTQEQLQLRSKSLNETCSAELAELNEEVSDLQAAKMALTKELSERENCVAQLALQVESLSAQVSKKQEEIEEIQCHATTNYNALLESREENQELKVELDIIKLESHNFEKKGNSLFGEVEDRRVEAERQLVSMKVQHSSLQKQHGLLRQQMHKLKMEVAGLLQMACRHDNERMTERLLQQLSQAQSEAQLLQKKLHQYEELERLEPRLTNRLVGSSSQAMNDGSVDHMKGLFSKTESEKACLKQELHTKTLIALAESNKVMECERRIFTLDHEVKQLKAHDFRQRLQIEELRMKYEPNSLNTDKLPQRKRNIEQIPLTQKLAADRDAVPAGDGHKEIIGDDNATADLITNKKSDASLENGRPRSLATKCMSDINTISPCGDICDDTTSADIVTNRKFDPSLEKRQSPLATKRTSDMNIMSPDGDCDAEVFPKSVTGRKRPTAVSDVDVADRSSSDAVGAHQGEQQGGAKMARVAKSKSVQLEQDCKVQ